MSAPAGRQTAVGDPATALVVLILLGLTAVRLAGLAASNVDLYVDEAQYWTWSLHPAFGYFSKPPLIAWLIGGASHLCGSGEACLRAPAPLLYLGLSLTIYHIARRLYGDGRIAAWAAVSAALAPGITFSSRIVTTDVPLLFFWSLALLAYLRLLEGGGRSWTVLLAFAFGLGLLAKYAMIYFVLCAVAAAFLDRRAAGLLRSPRLWLGLAGGVVLLLPNLAWNLANGLATFRHTGDNISGSGVTLDPFGPLGFLAAQFAIAGPVTAAAAAALALPAIRRGLVPADRLMLAFALPVVLLIAAVAFVTRAHANWAAPGLVSMFVLAPALLLRFGRQRLLAAGLALGLLVQAGLLAGDTLAYRLHLPLLAKGDIYTRTLGWRGLGNDGAAAAAAAGTAVLVADDRWLLAALAYYTRGAGLEVKAWPARGVAENQFELTDPLDATVAASGPLLAVSACPDAERYASLFAEVEPLAPVVAATGPTSTRLHYLFRLAGPLAAPAPLPPCDHRLAGQPIRSL